MRERWTVDRAGAWYDAQPWLVGCNFTPSTAVNQMEMWQEETFDPDTIDRELGWASGLGMNTMRVFLHDLAWEVDPEGFKRRIDRYLGIARRHGIATAFVLFDDCWYPDPKPGPQPGPRPGIHNPAWLQSPGIRAAVDRREWGRLEAYVRGIVGTFGGDDRVLLWDIYNELGNTFLPSLSLPWHRRVPKLAAGIFRHLCLPVRTLPLFRETLKWVRDVDPSQPITSGVWFINGRLNRELADSSDVITFHNYKPAEDLERQIAALKEQGRPVLCTEYMARTAGSRFETCLPVFKRERVGCYNWGLVSGRTQTIYSWADPGGGAEPDLWYHDILRRDGSPFSEEEAAFIRRMTAEG
jgi:hypothetical protein